MSNLWIRSQNNEILIKVDNLYCNGNDIYTCDANDNGVLLGKYLTEERALEVLDDIGDFITTKIDVHCGYQNVAKIYCMPED